MTWEGLTPPYRTIVADPPWPLAKIERRVRPNQRHRLDYSTLTLDDIAALPVADLACDTATLFVWTVDRYLHDTPAIVEGWGFRYHLTMAWDKGNGMPLYGFQRQTEFVVVGLRGRHEAYPARPTIRTSFAARPSGHSRKPGLFFDMVEALPGPYVELFCRQPRFGWDSYGYGYENFREMDKEAARGQS